MRWARDEVLPRLPIRSIGVCETAGVPQPTLPVAWGSCPASVVIEGSGHCPQIERPDAVIALFDEWFGGGHQDE